MLRNNLLKIGILLLLLSLLSLNVYSSLQKKDFLTEYKKQFFSLDGQSQFIGQLNLWSFFAIRDNWQQAALFESDLQQIEDFKKNNQPDQLYQLHNELQLKANKDAQDYLQLAKIQSTLGLKTQALDSIKKAHQLDPIRSDLDKLFYSTTDF